MPPKIDSPPVSADDLKNLSWVEFLNAGWFSSVDSKSEEFAAIEAEWNRRIEAMASDDEYEKLRFHVALASFGKTEDDLIEDIKNDATTNR